MSYYKSHDRDPSLPHPGASPIGAKLISREAHDAIVASTDLHALAMMRGYFTGYMGMMGLVLISLAGTVVGFAYAEPLWVAIAMIVFVGSASATVQARRRAVQWNSVIQARIDELLAGAAGNMDSSMKVGGDFKPSLLKISLFGRDSDDD